MADEAQSPDQAREVLPDRVWQLWAGRGWAAVTLDAAAGVDAAGFRAEFPAEVFDLSCEIRGAAALAAMDAVAEGQSRWYAAIESYVRLLQEDPRHVVVLVEAIGSQELRTRRRSSLRDFAVVMVGMVTRTSADPRDRLAAAHLLHRRVDRSDPGLAGPGHRPGPRRDTAPGHMLFELVMSGG